VKSSRSSLVVGEALKNASNAAHWGRRRSTGKASPRLYRERTGEKKADPIYKNAVILSEVRRQPNEVEGPLDGDDHSRCRYMHFHHEPRNESVRVGLTQ
jgi:hypothetical protein